MQRARIVGLILALGALVSACSGGTDTGAADARDSAGGLDAPADPGADPGGPGLDVPDAEALPEALPEAAGEADVPGDTGPLLLTRPEAGEPVPDADVAALTDLYLDLLSQTGWLRVTEERAHGWPRSDPQGRYWYGTWWSGVRVLKEGGAVTYLHSADGADNNGMRTGPILASVAWAHALWGGSEDLLRTLTRGFTSWGRVMQRASLPDQPVLLARASYPASVTSTEGGRTIHIDYSLNHPGVIEGRDDPDDPPPSIYVQNPDQPDWGALWIKNKRSKDDVGHMLLALAALEGLPAGTDADLATDVADAQALYEAFARRMEDEGWRIATVDEAWQTYWPQEDLAFFVQVGGFECGGMLAMRLLGRGDPGDLACGDGIVPSISEAWALKNDLHQIQRSFHEAAVAWAALRGHAALADDLRRGLIWRLDKVMDAVDAGGAYGLSGHEDLAELVTMSGAVGVPLTWREVRFLHARIRDAHDTYLAEGRLPAYHVFDEDTPDGEYPVAPGGSGLFWRYLAAPLGLCASPLVHPDTKPVLDCARLKAAGAPL